MSDDHLANEHDLLLQGGPMSEQWIAVDDGMPKPGVPVLAAFRYASHGTTRVVRAQWADKYTLPASDEHWWDECDYHEDEDEYYVPPGWYETNEFEEVNWKVPEKVTHWMPLPRHPDHGKDQ